MDAWNPRDTKTSVAAANTRSRRAVRLARTGDKAESPGGISCSCSDVERLVGREHDDCSDVHRRRAGLHIEQLRVNGTELFGASRVRGYRNDLGLSGLRYFGGDEVTRCHHVHLQKGMGEIVDSVRFRVSH